MEIKTDSDARNEYILLREVRTQIKDLHDQYKLTTDFIERGATVAEIALVQDIATEKLKRLNRFFRMNGFPQIT